MLTYNELVDLVEKINPDQIVEEIRQVLQTAILQIKEYVDASISTSETKLEGEIDEAISSIEFPKHYVHNIYAYRWNLTGNSKMCVSLQIINDSNNAFTYSTLAQYLYNNGFNDFSKLLHASGGYWYETSAKNCAISGIYSSNGTTIIMEGISFGGTMADTNNSELNLSTASTFNDSIVEI